LVAAKFKVKRERKLLGDSRFRAENKKRVRRNRLTLFEDLVELSGIEPLTS
jgi:hypothetical protein